LVDEERRRFKYVDRNEEEREEEREGLAANKVRISWGSTAWCGDPICSPQRGEGKLCLSSASPTVRASNMLCLQKQPHTINNIRS
jgi:hypothetical protein